MEAYQEVYNKIKEQLDNLKKELILIEKTEEKCDKERDIALSEDVSNKSHLECLKIKRREMFSSKTDKIEEWAPGISLIISSVIIMLFYQFGMDKVLVPFFNSFGSELFGIILSGLSFVGGGLMIIGINLVIADAISDLIIKRIVKKIENTNEYQQLVQKIEKQQEQVNISKRQLDIKKEEFEKAYDEKKRLRIEIEDREKMLNFIESLLHENESKNVFEKQEQTDKKKIKRL